MKGALLVGQIHGGVLHLLPHKPCPTLIFSTRGSLRMKIREFPEKKCAIMPDLEHFRILRAKSIRKIMKFLILEQSFCPKNVHFDAVKHFVKKKLVGPPKRAPGGIFAIFDKNFGGIFQ